MLDSVLNQAFLFYNLFLKNLSPKYGSILSSIIPYMQINACFFYFVIFLVKVTIGIVLIETPVTASITSIILDLYTAI